MPTTPNLEDIVARLDRVERLQKVTLALLCENTLGKGKSTREIDPAFVLDAVIGNHYWAIDMECSVL